WRRRAPAAARGGPSRSSGAAVRDIIESMWRFRRVLYASTRTELQKRYAGSLLGPVWPVLYPLLFLCAYLFLWMVVIDVRFPGMGRLGYVMYVFCGLVPFLLLSESLTAGVLSLPPNIHLLTSRIIPPRPL